MKGNIIIDTSNTGKHRLLYMYLRIVIYGKKLYFLAFSMNIAIDFFSRCNYPSPILPLKTSSCAIVFPFSSW